MKKILTISVVLILTCVTAMVMLISPEMTGESQAYAPGSGIKNSPHDLSANSAYYRSRRYNPEGETRICVFCHVPDDYSTADDLNSISLWNHASSDVIHYSPYNNGTGRPNDVNHKLDAYVSRGPGAVSKFCLSCHDGTVAVNRYGSLRGSVFMNGPSKIGNGGFLSNHHPIGFAYAGVTDNEINQSAFLGGHPLQSLLSDGCMECTTCHDVHNKGNSGEKLLWVSDRHSDLCCSCHLKCSK